MILVVIIILVYFSTLFVYNLSIFLWNNMEITSKELFFSITIPWVKIYRKVTTIKKGIKGIKISYMKPYPPRVPAAKIRQLLWYQNISGRESTASTTSWEGATVWYILDNHGNFNWYIKQESYTTTSSYV